MDNIFFSKVTTANLVFYRTYSRFLKDNIRESWEQVCERTINALAKLGKFSTEEYDLIYKMQLELKTLTSGRWLWVGGSEWLDKFENVYGGYNCTSTNLNDWNAFGLMMNLAMQGCGTGAIIESKYIDKLPIVCNKLNVSIRGKIGSIPIDKRRDDTYYTTDKNELIINVGDSRQGWVSSYQTLLELSTNKGFKDDIEIIVDVSNVRPSGELLKGFGGVANPIKLVDMYVKCANVINKAVGRRLNSVECCLLLDIAASAVVAGNIRRSAGMRQFSSDDDNAAVAKDNLWSEDENGNWRIDPERDPLRMSNHTRVFHSKPTLEECIHAVTKQYYSGEGAIQWAGEAVARSNRDILDNESLRLDFLTAYGKRIAKEWIRNRYPYMDSSELEHRISRYGLNPCGEILGNQYFCNLSEVHLNQIDPDNYQEQLEAFKAGALSVCALLHQKFNEPRYQYSRELDPIVGVSFTGLFDFFVNAFGVDWLRWWEQGRPTDNFIGQNFKHQEKKYLKYWHHFVEKTVKDYCDRHGLKCPNRYTTVQPSGTKSLLTGASPGWHPPKAQRFIRRITFSKQHPIALAAIDYGYTVIPSQSDKDEHGNLLNDPFDPRVTEWLVEVPVTVSWADLPGADEIDISKFSALAQMDFYMQVQRYYTTHNTSATIELRENEIEPLANRIYEAIENDEGYISAALLARYDDRQTYPRLPFEPITKEHYDRLVSKVEARRKSDYFHALLARYDSGEKMESGASACDSDKCMMPLSEPK